MSTLARFAAMGPHLHALGHLDLKSAGELVLDGSRAYVSAGKQVHFVDVSEVAAPRIVASLDFKERVGSLSLVRETLLVGERSRALHLVDVSRPTDPVVPDCVLSFGVDFYQAGVVGDFAAVAMNREGVGLLDVADPRNARWLDRVKLDEGFVERLAVASGRIFAAGASGGLRVMAIENGKLAEIARPCGAGFNASRVFPVGDRIWVVGTPPKKAGKRGGEPQQLVVIDPQKPDEVESRFDVNEWTPHCVLSLANGTGVGFNGYTCVAFDPKAAWSGTIFGQFTRDEGGAYVERPAQRPEHRDPDYDESPTSCMSDVKQAVRRGDELLLLRSDGLFTYRVTAESIFREG